MSFFRHPQFAAFISLSWQILACFLLSMLISFSLGKFLGFSKFFRVTIGVIFSALANGLLVYQFIRKIK